MNFMPIIFTVWCYASAILAIIMCLSAHLSVTCQYCIKTAKCRITERMPHDSPGTLLLWCQISWWNLIGITPNGGASAKCRCGRLKLATFSKYLAITWKQCKIDVWFVLTSNRKSYPFYQMIRLTLNCPKSPQFLLLHCLSYLCGGEPRDFRFDGQVGHSNSQPVDDKLSLKGLWSHHVTRFKFWGPKS